MPDSRIKKWEILLALCALGVGLYFFLAPHTVSKPASTFDPVFLPIIGELKAKTSLPIRLPKKLPEILRSGNSPVYAVVGEVGRSNYSVYFATSIDCAVRRVDSSCNLGHLSAASGLDLVTIEYAAWVKVVQLAHNISGMYFPSTQADMRNNGMISWKQGNVQYSVGIKAGSDNDLIPLANSVIDAEPIYTDNLALWNHYRNAKNGATFAYPFNWNLIDEGTGITLDNLDFKSTMSYSRCGADGLRCGETMTDSFITVSWRDPGARDDRYCPHAKEITFNGRKAFECGSQRGRYTIETDRVSIQFNHAKTRADLTKSERVFLGNFQINSI